MLTLIKDCAEYIVAGGAYLVGRTFRQMNQNLTPIEDCKSLSQTVFRVLGANPGPLTLRGTNTYLVGTGDKKILIDTGEPNVESYIRNLKEALGNSKIECIICTHWHQDHVGGIENVLEKITGEIVPVYKFRREDALEDYSKYTYITDGYVVRTEGATLRFFVYSHTFSTNVKIIWEPAKGVFRLIETPGHTMDHMSIYLEEEGSLFSGDCILGEGTTIFEDLHSYMKSLDKLLALKPTRIYPGHGPLVENPIEKISEYIAHRNKRECDILEALKELKCASSMQLTNAVYKDLGFAIKLAAWSNVNHHLSKLVKEKRVEKVGLGNYQLTSSNDDNSS